MPVLGDGGVLDIDHIMVNGCVSVAPVCRYDLHFKVMQLSVVDRWLVQQTLTEVPT
jgi:hypothetical protein